MGKVFKNNVFFIIGENMYFLLFLAIPLLYFYYYRRKVLDSDNSFWSDAKEFFGFKGFGLKEAKQTMVLLFLMIVSMFLINLIWSFFQPEALGIVSNQIRNIYRMWGFSFYVYIFVMAFSEELFFRVLLVDRFGIFLSTIFFALMHNAYGSYLAMLVSFILGLLLAFWWKKERNYYILFLAHFLYDLFVIWIAFLPK